MKKIHLFWIIPIVTFVMFWVGYGYGYMDEELNLKNGMDFCESLNDPFIYSTITHGSWKWCSQGLQTITCSSGSSCFQEEGSIQLIFGNPGLKFLEINYFDSERYPDPFALVEVSE